LVFDEMGRRPAHRTTPPGPDGTMAMQWALAHHDTGFVRTMLRETREAHAGLPASEDSPPDGVYTDALLYLAIGDTATAAQTLDIPLNNLLGMHSALFDYLPLVGAFVHMMAVRADLALTAAECRYETPRPTAFTRDQVVTVSFDSIRAYAARLHFDSLFGAADVRLVNFTTSVIGPGGDSAWIEPEKGAWAVDSNELAEGRIIARIRTKTVHKPQGYGPNWWTWWWVYQDTARKAWHGVLLS